MGTLRLVLMKNSEMVLYSDTGEPAKIVPQWAAVIPLSTLIIRVKSVLHKAYVHNHNYVIITQHPNPSMCDAHEHTCIHLLCVSYTSIYNKTFHV